MRLGHVSLLLASSLLIACGRAPTELPVEAASNAYFSAEHTYAIVHLETADVDVGTLTFCPQAENIGIEFDNVLAPDCMSDDQDTLRFGSLASQRPIGDDNPIRLQRVALSDGSIVAIGRVSLPGALSTREPVGKRRVLMSRTSGAGTAQILTPVTQIYAFPPQSVSFLGTMIRNGFILPPKAGESVVPLIEAEVTGPAGRSLAPYAAELAYMECERPDPNQKLSRYKRRLAASQRLCRVVVGPDADAAAPPQGGS